MSAIEVRIERQSSIEKEPRTLNFDQIHFAREEAMYVMNNRSMEEALRIFTKGLEPVVNCVGDEVDDLMNSGEELEISVCYTLKMDTPLYCSAEANNLKKNKLSVETRDLRLWD